MAATVDQIVKGFEKALDDARGYLSNQRDDLHFIKERERMLSDGYVWQDTFTSSGYVFKGFDNFDRDCDILKREKEEAAAEVKTAKRSYRVALASYIDLMNLINKC
jgi:hypothetical protein